MHASICSACGARTWRVPAIGEWDLILDPEPVGDGSVVVAQRHGQDIARMFDPRVDGDDCIRYRMHAVSCKQKGLF